METEKRIGEPKYKNVLTKFVCNERGPEYKWKGAHDEERL